MSNLYKKHNYKADISLIKNVNITEYDMKEGGYNLLKGSGVFTKKLTDKMDQLSKQERTILIGKMMREEPSLGKKLMELFVEARRLFFEANDIQDGEVLNIRKDAIFMLRPCEHTQINDYILFRPKETYIGYTNINDKEFFYNAAEDKLDVKGINKEVVLHHQNYLFKDLKKIMKKIINGYDSYIEDLMYLKYEFTANELDVGYYKDIIFNSYLINTYNQNIMCIDNIGQECVQYCMNNNNLNFILGMLAVLI